MPQPGLHKSFAGSSLYLFAARLFPALAAPVAFVLFSHRLPVGDYGHYQSFWIQLLLLSAIASAGLPVFVFSYAPEQLRALYRRLPLSFRTGYPIFVLGCGGLFCLLQYRSNGVAPLTALFAFLCYLPSGILEALLLVGKRFRYLLWSNLVFAVLFLLLHLQLLEQGYDLDLLIGLLGLLYLVRSLGSGIAVYRFYGRLKDSSLALGDWAILRRHWWHMGLNDVVQVTFRWIDKFVLALFLAKELLALYANATYDIPFLGLFFTAVSSAALMHWAGNRQYPAAAQVQVLHYSSRILSSVIFPLFFFLVCFSSSCLQLLYSEKYLAGVPVFICAQLMLPVRAYPFTGLLQYYQRGDIITRGAIADLLLACLLMYPLYLLLGLTGVALSFVLSTYLQAGYYLWHSARLLGQPLSALLPWRHLALKALMSGLPFAFLLLLRKWHMLSAGTTFISALVILLAGAAWALRHEWRNGARFFNPDTHAHTSQ